MCILIVLRGVDPTHPLVIAGNRDERLDRKAAPPGLYVGARRRMLSPRDRRAGGTWLAVDDGGRCAGITNIAGLQPVPDAPSRGHLVHLVLDHGDLDAGVAAVAARVREHAHSAFQLVAGDAARVVVVRHARGELRVTEWTEPVLVVTNEHEPGQLAPRRLSAALGRHPDVASRLDALATLLRDRGGDGHHAICKRGDTYGTVSSSLIALPTNAVTDTLWRYAAGPPDVTDYRNYGNLARRLLAES